MSLPPPPNLPQSAQEVFWEPGKNSRGESTLSAEHPPSAKAHSTTRKRRRTSAPIRLRNQVHEHGHGKRGPPTRIWQGALGDEIRMRLSSGSPAPTDYWKEFPAHPRDSQ